MDISWLASKHGYGLDSWHFILMFIFGENILSMLNIYKLSKFEMNAISS